MSSPNKPNTGYVAAPDQKPIDINMQYQQTQPQYMQPGQPQQQVYMQPGQQQVYMQPGQQVVYGQQGQQHFVTAAAPTQDPSEQMALILLIVGICCPLVWFISACMHWKSPNPTTKKYAKISLGLGIFQLVAVITIIVLAVVLGNSDDYYYNYRYGYSHYYY